MCAVYCDAADSWRANTDICLEYNWYRIKLIFGWVTFLPVPVQRATNFDGGALKGRILFYFSIRMRKVKVLDITFFFVLLLDPYILEAFK